MDSNVLPQHLNLYLAPSQTALPSIYDPLTKYQRLVLDAIDIGRMGMGQKPDVEIQTAIQEFAVKYGLFGLMTVLPTTPSFMDYEAVYLPKNHFIKEESMSTEKYLNFSFHLKNRIWSNTASNPCGIFQVTGQCWLWR